MFLISRRTGRHCTIGDLENLLEDQLFHFGSMVEYHLFPWKTSRESINLVGKYYLDCSWDTLCTREEFGKETFWSWTLRSWRRWTHQKSTQKTQCKRGDNAPKWWTVHIPDRRWKSKAFWSEIRIWEHPPWYGITHFEEKIINIFGEARNHFWSISEDFIYRQHVGTRDKLHTPREESCPIPMIYIDVTRAIHTTLDVMQESRIDDYWNIDGSRDLSDSWTGFTQFTSLKEKPPEGYTWSGRRLTKRQATSRPDYLWPEICKDMAKNSNLKEAKLGNRETEARQYQKAERYLLQWPWGRRIQRDYQECTEQMGSSDSPGHAM